MSYFQPLDGSVLLRGNGIYSEHQVYHRDNGEIFARKGNGYIRLMDHGATSKSRIFWSDLDLAETWLPHQGTLRLARLLPMEMKALPRKTRKAA